VGLDEYLEPEEVELRNKAHDLYMAEDYYRSHPMKDGYTPVYHLYKEPFNEIRLELYNLADFM